MKRILFVCILLTTLWSSLSAEVKKGSSEFFNRGCYCNVEASYGMVLDDNKLIYPDYGIKMAAGYRLCPQFVAAIGFEGVNSMATGTTTVPVFLQLRSDFIDAKVSPYAMLEIGYAFQFTVTKRSQEVIKVNDKIFEDRLGDMTLEEYLNQYEPDRRDVEFEKLKQFPNGERQYISYERYSDDMCFSKDGPYANLTLGVSWKVGEHRMNFGLTGGFSRYYHGTSIRTYENQFIDFGCVDLDPDGNKVIVRGYEPDLASRYKFSFRASIGFTF